MTAHPNLPACINKGQLVEYFKKRDGFCSYDKLSKKIFTDKVLEELGIDRTYYKKNSNFDIDVTERIYQRFGITTLEP